MTMDGILALQTAVGWHRFCCAHWLASPQPASSSLSGDPMPQINHQAPTVDDIWDFQRESGLSDDELGRAIIGGTFDTEAVILRWKAGSEMPCSSDFLAFHYLRALWRISALNPMDGEEIYSIAFSALPAPLQ